MNEKLPFPTTAIGIVATAFNEGRLTKEEAEQINLIFLAYLDVRAHLLYGDDL
jgi:hypothetical protein